MKIVCAVSGKEQKLKTKWEKIRIKKTFGFEKSYIKPLYILLK